MATVSYLTLLIVLALVLGAQSQYVPFKEFDPYPFSSPDTCGSSSSTWVTAVRAALAPSQQSNLITNTTVLLNYAEDYGHIYHRAPQAAFVPTCANDVVALVRLAKSFRNSSNRFQIVVRGGSGNVQGATQTTCGVRQVLLDTSLLDSVNIYDTYAWVGAGSPWLKFLQAAAAQNRRPTVLPDYMGLTVGGLVGIGGFGADSAAIGPVVDQVLEIQLVTPTGILRKVGPLSPYFRAVRGGLGNFGIITSVKYRLEQNEAMTRTYRVLTANYSAYFKAMDAFVDVHIPNKKVNTIQSFAISNAEFNLEIFIAPLAELDLVRPAVDEVLAQPQPWVYFLELTVRGTSNFLTKSQLAALLPPGINGDLIFITDQPTMDYDNRLKLFTVPALTANNGSWFKRHPWGLYNFPDSKIAEFKTILDNYDAFADSGFGLIAIYPYKTSTFSTNSFFALPRSGEHIYHVTLGQNELTDTAAGLAHIAQNNRNYWDALKVNSDASVYPSIYMPDWTPADWQEHYGSALKWNAIRAVKKALDPYFLLADTRNFGFASLY